MVESLALFPLLGRFGHVPDGTPMHPFITIIFLLLGVGVFILFIIALRTKVVYKKGDLNRTDEEIDTDRN